MLAPNKRGGISRLLGLAVLLATAGCGTAREPLLTPTPSPIPAPTLDANLVAKGRQVYLQSCARCHGENAEGAPNWQRPDARGDLPAPPHDDQGHTWRHSDAELREIIRGGMRDRFNKTPDLTMPPFKDQLRGEEIDAVITYLKSLWSPEHRRYQEAMSRTPTAVAGGGR